MDLDDAPTLCSWDNSLTGFQLFVVAVQNVIKESAGMTEQTALDNVLLGEGVKQMQEISREEILRQIFGDIGELADGEQILISVCTDPPIV